MIQKLKLGVIGASWFSDLWYLPVLAKHPEVTIQAICSKTGNSASAMAEKYKIDKVYTDFKQMFKTEQLDAVCIVTPNSEHKRMVMSAIEHGMHVICEKPLALNAQEANEMYGLAKESGIVHAVNFTYRENPAVQKIKELIKEEVIGRINEAKFEYSGDYGLGEPPGWRGTISQGGIGGVLQDLGSHLIDLAHEILDDKIMNVAGSVKFLEDGFLRSIHHKSTKDQASDSVTFIGEFSKGTLGIFLTSWIAPQGNKNQTIEITLHVDLGSIHFFASELGMTLRLGQSGEQWKDIHLEDIPPLDYASAPTEEKFRPWRTTNKNEVWKWIDRIIGKDNGTIATFKDGLHVQLVIDAVIESAKHNKRITVDYNNSVWSEEK